MHMFDEILGVLFLFSFECIVLSSRIIRDINHDGYDVSDGANNAMVHQLPL